MPPIERPNYGNATVLARALKKEPTDPMVTELLEAATAKFISHLGYRLDYHELDEIWLSGDGGPMLALPAAPVHDDPIINIIGHATVPALIGPGRYGVQVGRRTGILWRPAGWPDGIENIHITYTHGYQRIPADVEDAVTEAAILATTITPGVARVTSGDETIEFINRIVEGGTTANWGRVVDSYQLSNNGDGM